MEHTQFALIATVHKLYSMVRNSQSWDLGEPELNDRGQPVIHNIANKLGCIRPNSDMDLPVHSVFPEDEAGLNELARQLEEQQMERERDSREHEPASLKQETDSSCNGTDHTSPSEPDHSDFEQDYRRPPAFDEREATVTTSPQSLTYTDFDVGSLPSESFPCQSPSFETSPWMSRPASMDFGSNRFLQQPGPYMGMDMLSQGLLESNFGTIKPHVVSCANSGVMMGMGDPMIYSGYDPEALRL